MSVLRSPCAGFAPITCLFSFAGSSTDLKGESAIDFPAYLFNSGLTSNDSTCDSPPHKKIQMTLFARGAKCGRPDGARHPEPCGDAAALATPSRNNIAPSAIPVNPIPVSARNDLRETPVQFG